MADKSIGKPVGLNYSSHPDGVGKLDPNKNVIIDVWWKLLAVTGLALVLSGW